MMKDILVIRKKRGLFYNIQGPSLQNIGDGKLSILLFPSEEGFIYTCTDSYLLGKFYNCYFFIGDYYFCLVLML